MPHSRLPHCVLYDQLRLSHRSFVGQKKRFKDHIKSILKKCNISISRLETLASNRGTWRSTCALGMSFFDAECDRVEANRRSRRHQHAPVLCPISDSVHQCPLCGRQCFSRIDQAHPRQNQLSKLKRKSLSSVMAGIQIIRRRQLHEEQGC